MGQARLQEDMSTYVTDHLGIDTVVFDGHDPSAKVVTRDSTYRSAPKVVNASMNRCSSDSSDFLNSVNNNTSLISSFRNIMKCEGIKTLFCDNYICTKTV